MTSSVHLCNETLLILDYVELHCSYIFETFKSLSLGANENQLEYCNSHEQVVEEKQGFHSLGT